VDGRAVAGVLGLWKIFVWLALRDQKEAAEREKRLAVRLSRVSHGHALGERLDEFGGFVIGKSGEKRT